MSIIAAGTDIGAGGTVLVWHLGDAGEDRYLEPDPESIRDPRPRSTYRKPQQ